MGARHAGDGPDSERQQTMLGDSAFCRLARAHAKRMRWTMRRIEFARDLFGQPMEVAILADADGREVRRTADQMRWAAESGA